MSQFGSCEKDVCKGMSAVGLNGDSWELIPPGCLDVREEAAFFQEPLGGGQEGDHQGQPE